MTHVSSGATHAATGSRTAPQAPARPLPRIIAHRGYWRTCGSAQNSLTSFEKADALGVYGSETDVRLTADDALIIAHDRIFRSVDLDRTTERKAVSLMLENGEHLPTLGEYLELAASKPATRLVLEVKPPSEYRRERLAAKKVIEALKAYGMDARTDLISFSTDTCLTLHELMPGGRIFYLGGDLPPQKILQLGLTGIDYPMQTFRAHPAWISEAREAGLETNVWTVDSEREMLEFVELGVDYITTDAPQRLKALLEGWRQETQSGHPAPSIQRME